LSAIAARASGIIWCVPRLATLALLCALPACAADDRAAVKRDVAAIRSLRVDNRTEYAFSSVRDENRHATSGRAESAVFKDPQGDEEMRVQIVERSYDASRGDLLTGIGLIAAAASGGLTIERSVDTREIPVGEDGRYMLRVTATTPHGGYLLHGALLGGALLKEPDPIEPDRVTAARRDLFPYDPTPRPLVRLPARKMAGLTFRF
jgi:hypothetical protein